MKYLFLLLFPTVLLFTNCNDDDGIDRATVEVNFKALFADEDLAIQAGNYNYIDGSTQLLITLFQFYISDLELVPINGGEVVQLSEIELVRWSTPSDPAQLKFDFSDVPAGSYNVRFGLGVKPELNNMNPNEFPADYPLNEFEFWNETARYVFAKIEGNANIENDGLFDTPLVYHMGKDDFYTVLTYPTTIEIGTNESNTIDFEVDILDMMSSSDTEFTDVASPDAQVVNHINSPVTAQQFTNLRTAIVLVR